MTTSCFGLFCRWNGGEDEGAMKEKHILFTEMAAGLLIGVVAGVVYLLTLT
jgi:hypothetical protein